MKRRRIDLGLVMAILTALVPVLALTVYWARGEGFFDRFTGQYPASAVADLGPNGAVDVKVDARGGGRPISPLIYGVAFADGNVLNRLGATVNRWGGNTATTYNWVNRCWNAARDWEFRNKPVDQDPDEFIRQTIAAAATPLITIPTIGWVARDCSNSTGSVGVPDHAGSPVSAGSAAIRGYDPGRNRTAVYVQSAASRHANADPRAIYQDDWVGHLMDRFAGQNGGVRYYAMDNEPDAWGETHTDIRPVPMGYDEMVSNFEEYAGSVKNRDPTALILGPDLCCWTTMFNSDLDRGQDNFRTRLDRIAHGNQDFLPWWLQQVARRDRDSGRRTLDLLDVHFYPQAEGVVSDAADPTTQALRIRSVRALYDPHYRDESWIGTYVDFIPRLQQWIRESYPGTGLAITEYNFGGQKDASGAVAVAEALGIFGREGVDLANYWAYPGPDQPAGAAFRLYRNFDGAGATFGDRSLPVTVNHDGVLAFAARHSSRKEVDVVLVNESLTATAAVALQIQGATVQAAEEFRVAPGSAQIKQASLKGGSVSLPPLGLSLVRITLA